jgi:hypothetical protein
MAKPRNRPANTRSWKSWENPACCRAIMSKVWGSARKYIARNPRSMNTLPNSVYRKNLMAAYSRLGPPHSPIRKYIGTRTSSQKTKNRTRSKATKVPAIPVWSSSIRPTNALGRPGSGRYRHV